MGLRLIALMSENKHKTAKKKNKYFVPVFFISIIILASISLVSNLGVAERANDDKPEIVFLNISTIIDNNYFMN